MTRNLTWRSGRGPTDRAAPELRKNKTPAVDSSSEQDQIHLNDDATRQQADNDGSTETATAHIDVNEQSTMHDPDVLPHMCV